MKAPALVAAFTLCACLGGSGRPAGDDADASANPPADARPGDPPTNADARPGGQRRVTCSPLAVTISGLDTAIECVPDGMAGKTGSPTPLVVALHGYTQTADDYRATTEWDQLAARYGFYVVFPQTVGDLVNANGLPKAWRWWRDYLDLTRTSFNEHYAPILAVVDEMSAAHDIDPDRVFITGLSAGGYMTSLMLATHPDVFAAGASFSGGPANCDLQCTDSNKIQDWTRPPGYQPPAASDVVGAYASYWNDASSRKPRLMLVHGGLDEAVKPINLDDGMRQWTGALGIDQTPDNATLGLPDTLGGYPYRAYAYDGGIGVATILMSDLGHGTPVKPGDGVDEGGVDPIPSTTAADCSNVSDPGCQQDWTNTGAIYGAYQAAVFFGLTE